MKQITRKLLGFQQCPTCKGRGRSEKFEFFVFDREKKVCHSEDYIEFNSPMLSYNGKWEIHLLYPYHIMLFRIDRNPDDAPEYWIDVEEFEKYATRINKI